MRRLPWKKAVGNGDVTQTLSRRHTPASDKELELPEGKAIRTGPSRVLRFSVPLCLQSGGGSGRWGRLLQDGLGRALRWPPVL